MSGSKRTIESMLDLETGQEIYASSFFARPENEIFHYRRIQEEAFKEFQPAKFVCYYCRQMIKIKGGLADGKRKGLQSMHFAHFRDSDECPIKTNSKLTKEEIDAIKYNGAKESRDHITTKNMIGEFLELNEKQSKGVSDVIIDKLLFSERITSQRRKPDVRCLYNHHRLVFEIQLSTTYISVIADREHFYKQEGVYLIWVFKEFHQNAEEQTFTEKDIYYANYQNVFVLDDEAEARSREQNDLVLHCYFNKHSRAGSEWTQDWVDELITLSDITYDSKLKKAFFYNPDLHFKQLQVEYRKEQEAIRKKELKEQNRLEEEARRLEEEARKERELQEKFEAERQKEIDEFVEFKRKEAAKRQQETISAKEKLTKEIEESNIAQRNADIRRQQSSAAMGEGSNDIYQAALKSLVKRTQLINLYLVDNKTIVEDILNLFKEGYQPNNDDTTFLTNQFKKAQEKYINIAWRKHIENLAVSIFFLKVKKPEFLDCYTEVRGILLGLLSIKLKIPITQRLLSLQDFIAELIKNNPEHINLINKAITYFKVSDNPEIAIPDIIQDHQYDWVFELTFPELFQLNATDV